MAAVEAPSYYSLDINGGKFSNGQFSNDLPSAQNFSSEQRAALFATEQKPPPPLMATEIGSQPAAAVDTNRELLTRAATMMFGETLKPKYIYDLKTETEIPAIQDCCGKKIVRQDDCTDWCGSVKWTKREGIWRNDERLQEDPSSVLGTGFSMLHNTAPRMSVSVKGYHIEQRSRTVLTKGSGGAGFTHTSTEYYTKTITDWSHQVDVSGDIKPVGYMQAMPRKSGDAKTIAGVIKEYIDAENSIKYLSVYKDINWEYAKLREMITHGDRVRNELGWEKDLAITFPVSNHSVTTESTNALGNCWRSRWTKFFLCLTCTWIFLEPIMKARISKSPFRSV